MTSAYFYAPFKYDVRRCVMADAALLVVISDSGQYSQIRYVKETKDESNGRSFQRQLSSSSLQHCLQHSTLCPPIEQLRM
jgi:hypothetical protein